MRARCGHNLQRACLCMGFVWWCPEPATVMVSSTACRALECLVDSFALQEIGHTSAQPMKELNQTLEIARLLALRCRTSGFRSTVRFHSKKAGDRAPRVAHL
jgi:hypothetical protein